MDGHACPHCGKAFKYLSHYKRHLAAKTPCVPAFAGKPQIDIGKHVCRFCGRSFNDESSMYRHIRGACKIAPNPKNGEKGMERLYAHTLQKHNAEMQSELAEQGTKIDRLEDMMRQLLRNQGAAPQAGEVAIQGNHAQVDNSKKIININVFGQEKLDHITAERIKTILNECLQQPALPTAVGEAVLKTAMLVYSDPDRPENLTAYLPNKKTKDALVHTQAGWEVQPTQLILPPMALKSIDAIFGKQPHEDEYAPLLKELQQNEARFAAGEDLQPIRETRTYSRECWQRCQ